ncbi:MAG TPA: hypothetical protein PLQ03_09660 [Brevundimonas sp.]|uniref:thermonuclease family protein n=1 Tax=Brevundimonas sp. TaxID=1871086 RepID=UPI002635F502|nr:hypothetical protein [Brevundimonas sp.]HRO33662.1 hypothetical protein [Brevundimonas sp.]
MRSLLLVIALVALSACEAPNDVVNEPLMRSSQKVSVLDGDTVIVDGVLVRLADVDAPELGPWAKCWAEAALAGHARLEAQTLLLDGVVRGDRWKVVPISTADDDGRVRGRIISEDGRDLSDSLVVSGYAARTSGTWDWCGIDADLHSPTQEEPAPKGPNLWWPSNHMFDRRAGD